MVPLGLFPPAPFNKISTVPNFSFIVFFAASRLSFSSTFAAMPIAVPPSALISSAVFFAASPFKSSTATAAPVFATAFANIEHSTPPPPVTMAVFPFKSISNGNFISINPFQCFPYSLCHTNRTPVCPFLPISFCRGRDGYIRQSPRHDMPL